MRIISLTAILALTACGFGSGGTSDEPSVARRLQDIEARMFKLERLPGPRGPVGETGPQGSTGAQGLQGPAGAIGPMGATPPLAHLIRKVDGHDLGVWTGKSRALFSLNSELLNVDYQSGCMMYFDDYLCRSNPAIPHDCLLDGGLETLITGTAFISAHNTIVKPSALPRSGFVPRSFLIMENGVKACKYANGSPNAITWFQVVDTGFSQVGYGWDELAIEYR